MAPRHPAKAPGRASAASPYQACSVALHHIKEMVKLRIPSYRKVDMSAYLCTDAQYYHGFFYQGLNSYYQGDMDDALVYLKMAKDISGPYDEKLLFHLWKAEQSLGDLEEQQSLYLEMRKRFPASSYLANMAAVEGRARAQTSFIAINSLGYLSAHESGQGPKAQTYLSLTRTYGLGHHSLEASVNVFGNQAFRKAGPPAYSYEGALAYGLAGFRIETTLGRSQSYQSASSASGPDSSAHYHQERYFSAGASQALALPARFSTELGVAWMDYGEDYQSLSLHAGIMRRWVGLLFNLDAQGDRETFGYTRCVDYDTGTYEPICSQASLHRKGAELRAGATWERGMNRIRGTLKARMERDESPFSGGERMGSAIGYHAYTLTRCWKVQHSLEGGWKFQGGGNAPFYRYNLSLVFQL